MSKKRLWLILLLIFFWLLGAFLVGFYLSSGRKISFNLPSAKFKKQFKLKPAQPDPQISKSKKIGPDGGNISLVDDNGVKINLMILPKALSQDTEIKISSLPQAPVDNLETGENQPGVFIEPVNLRFNLPARVVFDFNPANDASAAGVMPLPPTNQGQAAQPQPQPSTEPELTEEEQSRRAGSQPSSPTERASVVHTDSSSTQAGTSVIYSPTQTNPDQDQIQTRADGGGSYNVDSEVDKAEARENINNVLDNPNASFEEILEAAGLAQAWGFDDLDNKAKEKLKAKIDEVVKDMNQRCGQAAKPMGKQEILKWQGIAQALGFEKQEQKFNDLLQNCQGYYSFALNLSIPEFSYTYKASVCGFIDDTWYGEATGSYLSPCTGSIRTTPYSFSFPSGGGYANVNFELICSPCCDGYCYTGSDFISGPFFYYDGLETVSLGYSISDRINFQKNCPAADALPPLVPIPVGD